MRPSLNQCRRPRRRFCSCRYLIGDDVQTDYLRSISFHWQDSPYNVDPERPGEVDDFTAAMLKKEGKTLSDLESEIVQAPFVQVRIGRMIVVYLAARIGKCPKPSSSAVVFMSDHAARSL